MIKRTDNAQAEQARRLRIKTQEQRLTKLAVDGAGLSPWEAETLTEVVKEVFFAEPENTPLRSGQMFYGAGVRAGVSPLKSLFCEFLCFWWPILKLKFQGLEN